MATARLRTDLDFTMPFSNVLHLPFPEKIRATRLAGFAGLTLQPQEVLKIVAEGTSTAEMRKIADGAGVAITRMDPLCPWTPDWHPVAMGEQYIKDHTVEQTMFFSLCEELGCTLMSLNATFPPERYSTDQVVEHYAEICRKAAEHGITCDLEAIPMWGVISLEVAWDIVRRADAPNGGFVFDCTHFVRGNSSLETLKAIPGHLIHCVQVCDGRIPLPAGVTLEQECFERLWPGQGDFPIGDMLRTLNATGGLRGIGPEVFSASLAGMTAEQIAEMSSASLAQYDVLAERH